MNGEASGQSLIDEQSGLPEPKLYQHCVAFYDLLRQNTTPTPEGDMYVGSLSTFMDDLGLSVSYQSKIVRRLKDMGCIVCTKRAGGGVVKSEWIAIQPPTIEMFRSVDRTGDAKWVEKRHQRDSIAQAIGDLTRRIDRAEHRLDTLYRVPPSTWIEALNNKVEVEEHPDAQFDSQPEYSSEDNITDVIEFEDNNDNDPKTFGEEVIMEVDAGYGTGSDG